MIPAETIAAAIEKLVELRVSPAGPWQIDGPEYHYYGGEDGMFVNTSLISAGPNRVGIVGAPIADRYLTLIVTLHRTIDAQLAILGFALEKAYAFPTTYPIGATEKSHLDLARTILGEEV